MGWVAYKGLKKCSGGGGGVESDYSVCPRPFLQFLQFCQFMLVRLHQVTSGYIRLRQFTLEEQDVELDKTSPPFAKHQNLRFDLLIDDILFY